MSLTKALLFGDNPLFDKDRKRLWGQAAATIAQFPVPLRGKRKGADGKWSPHWNLSVDLAAKELGIEYIPVNSRFAFKTSADKIAVTKRAEIIWQAKVAEYQEWLSSSKPKR